MTLIRTTLLSSAALILSACGSTQQANNLEVKYEHIRNATALVHYGETVFLIDPMLADVGAYPGIGGTYNSELRNPLIPLPSSASEILSEVDAVIVTHTHNDHWDRAAQEQIPKNMPIFTQNEIDAERIRGQGFTNVTAIGSRVTFEGIEIYRTGGQHGTDALYAIPQFANGLGQVMGVVLKQESALTTYIAGDTIWHPEVETAITAHSPDLIVLNTGNAQFVGFENDPILMGEEDPQRALTLQPNAQVIAVHMNALNHMRLTREELIDYLRSQQLEAKVAVPLEGEVIRTAQ
ncbi:MAG: beta-lactamase family lipoprotein [Idiomarinaceae bacterium HL-53]|nr:MAG: beta-lactamase family lipoprotein [Idiomarinaceae bacterium HL-53]CUS47457.1 L-ascorbate metabolism protein UlaG, beta-lactamase superfamily [Idiomarinaceae bacterium HL-53]